MNCFTDIKTRIASSCTDDVAQIFVQRYIKPLTSSHSHVVLTHCSSLSSTNRKYFLMASSASSLSSSSYTCELVVFVLPSIVAGVLVFFLFCFFLVIFCFVCFFSYFFSFVFYSFEMFGSFNQLTTLKLFEQLPTTTQPHNRLLILAFSPQQYILNQYILHSNIKIISNVLSRKLNIKVLNGKNFKTKIIFVDLFQYSWKSFVNSAKTKQIQAKNELLPKHHGFLHTYAIYRPKLILFVISYSTNHLKQDNEIMAKSYKNQFKTIVFRTILSLNRITAITTNICYCSSATNPSVTFTKNAKVAHKLKDLTTL